MLVTLLLVSPVAEAGSLSLLDEQLEAPSLTALPVLPAVPERRLWEVPSLSLPGLGDLRVRAVTAPDVEPAPFELPRPAVFVFEVRF